MHVLSGGSPLQISANVYVAPVREFENRQIWWLKWKQYYLQSDLKFR